MSRELENTVKLQQIAANPRDSAWVFAAAGAGKTKVLTDRVLRLLLDDVKPHKILCLTFTKNAAAEMQHRINNRLAELVILDDKELTQNLAALTGETVSETLLKKARILFAQIIDLDSQIKVQTIHSFCQNLVKIFPFEIGANPNFEVMDGNLEKLFLLKAKKETLTAALKNKALRDVVEKISGKLNEESFLELTAKILAQKEKLVFLKNELHGTNNLISEIFKIFAVRQDENEEEIFNQFLLQIPRAQILEMASDLENSQMKTDNKTASSLKNFLKNPILKNFDIYREVFLTAENLPKKISSICTKEFVQYADFIASQQELVLDFLDHLNSYKTASNTALLLKFIDAILEKYQELKTQHSLLDYNDLIIKTEKMLRDHAEADWVKSRMDGFFDHILIDESQDTNHRQWNIIKALTEDFFAGIGAQNKNRTIFIIGDDKQSIYSFQGSEPNISHEIFNYYQQKLENSAFKFHKIDLSTSFRSLPNILQIVDAVFLNQNHLGIADYKAHRAIREGRGRVEIWPHIKRKKSSVSEENAELTTSLKSEVKDIFSWRKISENFADEEFCEKEFLAEIIALKIRSWLDIRHCKASDIMVLLRNRTNGFDKILQQKFVQNSIPFSSTKKANFSEELLVQDLLAAAKFALLPQDDLNFAALLKSPFFRFSEEDLFKISVLRNRNNIDLYSALKLDKSRLEVVLQLEEIIIKSHQLNCFEFFSFLLDKNTKQNFIIEFGDEALPIIDQFLVEVFEFYKNSSPNLQKFVEFVEKLDPNIAIDLEKNNKVTITTIHAAKGLEAPIVILPDCCFNFNQVPNAKENFFFVDTKINDESYQLPIWCGRKSEESKLVKLYKAQKVTIAKEEYFRLFYVAMTRARNELYIAGFGANAVDSWHEIAKKAGNFTKIDFKENILALKSDNIEKNIPKFEIADEILSLV